MKIFLASMVFFASLCFLTAAEITVPRLEMASRGRIEDGEFVLGSVVSADLALSGGYKYGLLLGFSFEAADLSKAFAYRNFNFRHLPAGTTLVDPEDYNSLVDQVNDRLNNQGTLSFRVATATARDLFNQPLELSFFIGEAGYFCGGGEFTDRFNVEPIGTEFRGFFYFPDGIGGDITRQYQGIHGVRGAGLSLALTPWESVIPMLYLYQDFSYAQMVNGETRRTRYSGDLRFLINRESVKLEAFGGLSFNSGDTNIRGGLMAHFSSRQRVEFLLQGGVPGWEKGDDFSIDNFYFLMEPRLIFDTFGFYVTFFYHPLEYMHVKTAEERGKADINVKFLSGNANTGFSWGLETTLGLKIDGMEDFSVWVSPFAGFMASGLRWDTKIRVNTLAWETPAEMFELFIGVRTAF